MIGALHMQMGKICVPLCNVMSGAGWFTVFLIQKTHKKCYAYWYFHIFFYLFKVLRYTSFLIQKIHEKYYIDIFTHSFVFFKVSKAVGEFGVAVETLLRIYNKKIVGRY